MLSFHCIDNKHYIKFAHKMKVDDKNLVAFLGDEQNNISVRP